MDDRDNFENQGSAPDDDWHRFSIASRVEASVRNQKFLILGSVLVVIFTAFDMFSESLTPVELQLRVLNNAVVLVALASLILVLRSPWGRRAVFGLLFSMAAAVLIGQAYLLTEVTPAPGRLAFHYLTVLGLTMAGIQWFWRWQVALGSVAVTLVAVSVPPDHPDFGFYLLSLAGCAILSAVFGHALVLLRFDQFVATRKLQEVNQDNVRRRVALESLNSEMRDFAYAISHDLRAPLINISGFAAATADSINELEAALAAHSSEEAFRSDWERTRDDMKESLDFVRKAGEKMSRLIEGILKLSRLDRASSEVADVDLNPVVDEVVATFQHQIGEREIEIEIGALPTVRGDRLRLSQLFGNLIDNSIKYMKDSDDAHIVVECTDCDGKRVFRVRDNGIGIRREDHDKIFRIFARSGNQQAPGDGIGLSAVKKIVDQHHGAIWIDATLSDLGRGTTICFTLPTSPTNDAPADI